MNTNLFLSALSSATRSSLDLHRHDFKHGQILHTRGEIIERVFFPLDSITSLVIQLENGLAIETAMVGRDGVVGGLCAVDDRIALDTAMTQYAGQVLSCSSSAFKSAFHADVPMQLLLVRHERVLLAQAQQSAACNAAHQLGARLARWLMRASDLTGGLPLKFTQEFLAEMLGVSRTSVSLTAHLFQEAGILNYSRGRIAVLDEARLKDAACECYGSVKANYDAIWKAR